MFRQRSQEALRPVARRRSAQCRRDRLQARLTDDSIRGRSLT